MSPLQISLRWPLLLALALSVWVASFTHEFTHHAVGALVCGEVGRMSLNRFALVDGCAGPWPVSTAAGPALSYLMMWLGAWLVRRRRHPLLGLALVVAYIPFLRLLTATMGGGDEGMLVRLVAPAQARWLAPLLVLALVLPPLLTCWRALDGPRRAGLFAGLFLLPLLPVLPVPALDGRLMGDWLAGTRWWPNLFGVPWWVWGIHATMALACAAAWWRLRWRRALRLRHAVAGSAGVVR